MNQKVDDLLLHVQTKKQIEHLLARKPQSIILVGATGCGKKTLAEAIAAKLLQTDQDLAGYPHFIHIAKEEKLQDIPIESIRKIIKSLQLKVPGSADIRRIVFIEDAQRMSIPAQNALLKVLEEPNPETVFILSVTSVPSILPTIASRAQQVNVLPVSLEESLKYWSNEQANTIESAWRLSAGSAGLLSALLDPTQQHPLKAAVGDVKEFLKANTYHRLLLADQISRDKDRFAYFLEALTRTLGALHYVALRSGGVKANSLLASRKLILKLSDSFNNNASAKLLSLQMVLKIKV